MDKLVVQQSGPLEGAVSVRGAKNAALPLMAACLMAPAKNTIHNVPAVRDAMTMARILEQLGADVRFDDDGVVTVDATDVSSYEAPYDLVRTMRGSFFVLGPLLARFGRARVSLPGGCAIGDRPVDLHLKGLARLGAELVFDAGYVEARTDRLKGGNIWLDYPSVGATENVIMAAVRASGPTVIENAAREPEIVDLADCLNRMGCNIEGAGTGTIKIGPVDEIHGANHTLVPDRISAGTFLLAGAVSRGKVFVNGAVAEHLRALLEKLSEMGVSVEVTDSGVGVSVAGDLNPMDVVAMPYPGFVTDLQPQMMALLCTVPGMSKVTETVFPKRFMHASELARMGAEIEVAGNTAVINGNRNLVGAEVMASDLRGGASLILAGLVAKGETSVSRVYHVDRGYERIEDRLAELGAKIERVKE